MQYLSVVFCTPLSLQLLNRSEKIPGAPTWRWGLLWNSPQGLNIRVLIRSEIQKSQSPFALIYNVFIWICALHFKVFIISSNILNGWSGQKPWWNWYLAPVVNFGEVRRAQLAKFTLLTSTLGPLGSFQICSDAKERVGCGKQQEAIAPIHP